MKRIVLAVAFPLLLSAGSAFAGGNVSIGLDISGEVAPGVYGNVVIGNRHPSLVYGQPIIVHPTHPYAEPLYLHVSPEYVRHWGRYCDEYRACDRQVYFVRSSEYRNFHGDWRHDYRDEWQHEHESRHDW